MIAFFGKIKFTEHVENVTVIDSSKMYPTYVPTYGVLQSRLDEARDNLRLLQQENDRLRREVMAIHRVSTIKAVPMNLCAYCGDLLS